MDDLPPLVAEDNQRPANVPYRDNVCYHCKQFVGQHSISVDTVEIWVGTQSFLIDRVLCHTCHELRIRDNWSRDRNFINNA